MQKDPKLWSDFEMELGKYTSKVASPEEMKSVYIDISTNLKQYISSQDSSFREQKDSVKSLLLEDVCAPENYFLQTDKAKLSTHYSDYRSQGAVEFNFISFNYTLSLEKIIGELKDIKYDKNVCGNLKPIFGSIFHVHHTINENVILVGVNSPEQIDNKVFRDKNIIANLLVKPNMNKMLKSGVDNRCLDLIKRTDMFVLFGLSLGKSDSMWWESIAKFLLIDVNKRVAITIDAII